MGGPHKFHSRQADDACGRGGGTGRDFVDIVDIVDIVDNVKTAHLRPSAATTFRRDNVNIVNNVRVSKPSLSPLTSAFSAIERQCSDLVSVADWQRAVDDGRLFIVRWGERAEALGWTAQDLFGLHDPPEQRGPNYRRLSRHDVTGLIWPLHGRPVVAHTADRAVIGAAGGGVTFYRMATQNR
jgi:hypothetical protein